jgi:diguanylate cyclase (GGDEF)-like protein
MHRIDPPTLRKAAEQIRRATEEHSEWHENLLRSIFCGQEIVREDLAPFAHRWCCIGRWYYERVPPELRGYKSFAALGTEHEHLHAVAARMLREAEAGRQAARADFDELVAASARLRVAIESLRASIEAALANRDPLTGAYGRVEMVPELIELHEQTRCDGKPCCIVFMDVDHLKRINDEHGHQVGNAVLAGVVRQLESQLRPQDKLFRYGGDEFLITLPGADLAAGHTVVTRIRESLAHNVLITDPLGTALRVTASFGLALLDAEVDVPECVARADQALILAKTAGRNRAILWDPSVTTSTRWRQLQVDKKLV